MAAPSQDSLYKYCSATTAKQVLMTKSLRWCSPHLFNDPLELNHFSELNFGTNELLSSAVKMATSFIFAKEIPRGNAPLLAAVRRWRDEERFDSPEEAEDVLKDLMSQMIDQRLEEIVKIKNDWKSFTRHLRIASFNSKPDNLTAWDQLANRHRGVVLRFQCEGSPSLQNPHIVHYQPTRPEVTTLKEQLGIILLNENFIAQEHFLEKFTCKAPQFKGLQELRCFYQQKDQEKTIDDNSDSWFIDREFGESNLRAVFFGLSISDADKNEIMTMVKHHYQAVKFFDMKLPSGKYELEFERSVAP